MIQALICLTLLIVSALSVLSPNVLPTPRWCPTSRVGPAAVGAGWCSLPCNWEFAHRTDILFNVWLTSYMPIAIDVVCGAGTPPWWSPHCAVCSLHCAASSFYLFLESVFKARQMKEKSGTRKLWGEGGDLRFLKPDTAKNSKSSSKLLFPQSIKKVHDEVYLSLLSTNLLHWKHRRRGHFAACNKHY